MRARRLFVAAAIVAIALAMLRLEAHWQGPVAITFNADNGLHLGDLVVLGVAVVCASAVLIRRP